MPVRKADSDELPLDILVAARTTFSTFDRDNSGAIDSKELRLMLSSMHVQVTDDELLDLLTAVDLDKSGEMDFDEFVKVIATSLQQPTPEEELEGAFEAMGGMSPTRQSLDVRRSMHMSGGTPSPKDGNIDGKSIAAALEEFGLKADESVTSAKTVTYEEFKSFMQ